MVDLEAQLAADEGQDEATLRERDRSLYRDIRPHLAGALAGTQGEQASDDALLTAWLAALRERFGKPQLGDRLTFAQRIVAYVLLVSGLSLGWGTAELLLHFEQGGAPVNLGYYLLVLVLGQLAALLVLLASLLLRSLLPRLPLVGDVTRLLRFVAAGLQRRLAKAHVAAAEELAAQAVALRRVQTRAGLYARLERYLLLSQTQLFAVAFNLGALASCMRLIFLSDLAFSWSTSVASLDAAQVHQLCSVLSWPFAWLFPDAVPTRELIEHTQYFRLEGRFAGAAPGTRGDARMVGEWWRFLIACTITYGLLPRLVALTVFYGRLRAAQRNVPLDTPLVQRVIARMTTPVLSTQAQDLRPQGAAPGLVVEAVAQKRGDTTVLVLYRDIPTEPALLARVVSESFGAQVQGVQRAGGLDVEAELAWCRSLRDQASTVTVVAEAWEAPDKSLRTLLARVREALGPQRALRVALIGEASKDGFTAAAAEDVRVYADRLTLLRDPYLIVETLPALPQTAPVGEGAAS